LLLRPHGDGCGDLPGQFLRALEELHEVSGHDFSPQGLDLLPAHTFLHLAAWPGRVFVQQEDQALQAGLACMPVLQFGDGALLARRDVAVAPGENPNVNSARSHVGQALVQRTLASGHIVFHGHHVVPHLA